MRMTSPDFAMLSGALAKGLRAFKDHNWVRISAASSLLLMVALWVAVPQVGQAQGAAPAQPTGLTATAGDAQATLIWDDPSDGSITGYEYLQTQVAKLTASDGAADDEFGYSVAVDGDTAVVGAHGDNGDKGAAYVLTRQSGVWGQVAKLTASDGAAPDHFGISVAVDGDTVVVGSVFDDSFKGSAYVFIKPNGGWADTTETGKLTASDRTLGDQFGQSVTVDGDTIVVGAYNDDDGGENDSGSAYVFTEPNGGWADATETAKLTASNEHNGDQLGYSVAVEGGTVVAGAHEYDDSGSSSGSIYVFNEPASGAWADATETARLSASDGGVNDYFGSSVSVDGNTAVVGAYGVADNKGAAYVFTRQAGAWSQVAKLTASDGVTFNLFGQTVAVDGDTVVVGANLKDSSQGGAYVFTKPSGGWTDATETAKLTASDGAPYDLFGTSVAVEGDTVVVSAWKDDLTKGSAYVFTKPTSVWTDATETAKLTASDRANADYFGVSVAVDGDTVVVGANGDDSQKGSAYVFKEPNGGWSTATETAKLTTSDRATHDNFGQTVAVDGDTVVAGAWGDHSGRGAAYVFEEPNGGWADATETAKLTASDGADDDDFGSSVAVDGDTVVVGTPGDTDNGPESGSAYVFTKPDTGWTSTSTAAKLTASDGAPLDDFGWSVTVDGDTVMAGAGYDGDKGSHSGSVYVYEVSDWTAIPDSGPGETNATSHTVTGLTNYEEHSFWIRAANSVGSGPPHDAVSVMVGPPAKPTGLAATAGDTQATLTWDDPSDASITGYEYLQIQVAKLTASEEAADDEFGYSVAVDGDTMVVGAPGDGNDTGAAYVFTRQSGAWSQVAKLTASDGAASDRFGTSVAVDGDTVVVGAGWANDTESGAAYVFTKPSSGGWADATETAKLTASDGADGDDFAASVSVDGDTVVVGAWQTDHIDTSSGAAYVFTKPGTGWADATETAKLTASHGAAYDEFAYSVGVEGDTVVVGAYGDDDDGESSGAAYVFTRPANGWISTTTETAKLTPSDGAYGGGFGWSVAVDGDTVVVGATPEDTNGSAYVFTKPATGWTSTSTSTKLTASDGAATDDFGWSVTVDGDTVVVGAHQDNDNGNYSGAAYVYEVSDWTDIPVSAAGETNATSYTVTGLTNDEEYDFRIRAANDVGTSPASYAVTVTPTS